MLYVDDDDLDPRDFVEHSFAEGPTCMLFDEAYLQDLKSEGTEFSIPFVKVLEYASENDISLIQIAK